MPHHMMQKSHNHPAQIPQLSHIVRFVSRPSSVAHKDVNTIRNLRICNDLIVSNAACYDVLMRA